MQFPYVIHGETGESGKGIFLFWVKVWGFGTACVTDKGTAASVVTDVGFSAGGQDPTPLTPTSITPRDGDLRSSGVYQRSAYTPGSAEGQQAPSPPWGSRNDPRQTCFSSYFITLHPVFLSQLKPSPEIGHSGFTHTPPAPILASWRDTGHKLILQMITKSLAFAPTPVQAL